MSSSQGQSFLREFREFRRFLASLWGTLSGISLLFPLSNVFLTVIPIDELNQPFNGLRPAPLTAMTMVVCIFITFATFSRRERFREPARRLRIGRVARISFVVGLASGAVYLLARGFSYNNVIELGDGSEGVHYLNFALFEGFFAVAYVAFFGCLTRSFLVLAMLEFYQPKQPSAEVSEPSSG
ncbi:MAG: hypothetical protein GEV28_36150 [Actinophytocola sp.]|uniref:hypothetical protein n=1 Tax=Actinophytocola sp. TaxID=1872138 RepID=UPI00132222B4|nr:hypothetical protein [Actinophytocola sp.]MPZ85523.1 hypothetical protein [Actinophytocola sp.]